MVVKRFSFFSAIPCNNEQQEDTAKFAAWKNPLHCEND